MRKISSVFPLTSVILAMSATTAVCGLLYDNWWSEVLADLDLSDLSGDDLP